MGTRIGSDRGGFMHLVLAIVILGSVAATGHFGVSLNGLIEGGSLPSKLATTADKKASCAANTIDTIAGTFGCGSSKTGSHLTGITILSAKK